MEEDFFNPFTQDGKVTLVIDQSHASFEVAQEVALRINTQLDFQQSGQEPIARAVNQQNVEVSIPQQYLSDPVDIVSQILRLEIGLGRDVQTEARVVINERTGSVVIDGNVEVGDAVITSRNVVVETGQAALGDAWRPLHLGTEPPAQLKALVESLNAMRVPPQDIIDVIKGLERSGKLHGRVIIQ
jgi:flagellar P-ring protein precursor FlgI